ncbi:cupin domain-containing protein [Pseudonocardia xinjiangensis]|uniref:Cupin domain-containing protein n=1 Tax=Pseudonocardia xinjiangensis TaxID=75289 RepID=A0ABX1RDX7_9PSEU|nr:cupin domain-containing protein [Pseudonocardia xinjiangensis]NMH78600.1 cupin domain-containing protein [Pseudonocardia xinjiangensis]
MSSPYVAQPGDHEQLKWIDGGTIEVLLDARHTGGHLSIFRSTVPTRTASPVHVHPDEDEIVVMLSGSGVIWIGDRRCELTSGGVAFLPRGIPHAYRFTSDNVDMLTIATPSGWRGSSATRAGTGPSRRRLAGRSPRPSWARPPPRTVRSCWARRLPPTT